MADEGDDDLAAIVCTQQACSVVAAAGCGKTEQIVKATMQGEGRRLILTHTHAGVDSIRDRLRKNNVPSAQYFLDTIAGWCLRYVASYPASSKLKLVEPKSNQDWTAVYAAARTLLASGAVNRVLRASYSGVLVDEYQDCSGQQHDVIAELRAIIPVCVFGDPLQAIFDFKGQVPLDWVTVVFPQFPHVRTLTKPHRWLRHGNFQLAEWLKKVRRGLEDGAPIDLQHAPPCVSWDWLPDWEGPRQQKILATCRGAMSLDGNLVVIADPMNLNGRAAIAKGLAKQGFSNIEPIDCKSLHAAAKKLAAATSQKQFDATLEFLTKCMSGISAARFAEAVASKKAGGARGRTAFGDLIEFGCALQDGAGLPASLALVEGFAQLATTYVFRRQMFSAMRSALRMTIEGECANLSDAVWQVQNRIRHAGRNIAYRSVGSTLLVKGLQFANAVVVHSESMNRNDWYVALTRATHTLTVLSPLRRFAPPA